MNTILKNLPTIVVIFLSALFAVFFVSIYVGHEEPIYYWDYAGYFDQFQNFGLMCIHNTRLCISSLKNSIAYSSYSSFPVLLLLPFYYFFGSSRLSYICGIVITYLIPTCILSAYLASKMSRNSKEKFSIAAFLSALLYTLYWAPTLRGYISIGGILFLGGAILIAINTRFLSQATLSKSIAFGVLLWASFLFRRWYAPSIIAVGGISFLFSLKEFIFLHQIKKSIFKILSNYTAAALIALFLGIIFQLPLLETIIHTNYSYRYSFYQLNFIETLKDYYNHFGFFASVMIFLGIIRVFYRIDYYGLFFLGSAIATAVIFSTIQAPGMQQLLPIAFMLFPLYFNGIFLCYLYMKDIFGRSLSIAVSSGLALRYSSALSIFILSLLLLFNFFNTFNSHKINLGLLSFISPLNHVPPLRIENYKNYQSLSREIQIITTNKNRFGVLSASRLLNLSMLLSIDPSLQGRYNYEADIDNRDHFEWTLLTSKYLILATPNQGSGQYVIDIPANDLREGYGFGSSYEKFGNRYKLADGVTAQIYKKTKPISAEQVKKLVEQFNKHFPSWYPNTPHINGIEIAENALQITNQKNAYYGLPSSPFEVYWDGKTNTITFYKDKCSLADLTRRFFIHATFANGKKNIIGLSPVRYWHSGFITKDGCCAAFIHLRNRPKQILFGQFSTYKHRSSISYKNYWAAKYVPQ